MEPLPPPAGAQRSAVPAQRPAADPADVPPALPADPADVPPALPADPADVPPSPAPSGPTPHVPAQRVPPDRVEPVSPAEPRPGRLRLVLAVLGGMLALLCLGGVGLAYILYDAATAPERGAPDVVVDNYLRAYLVDRDDERADLYVCQDAAALDELRSFRDDLTDRERRFSIRIAITWGSLTVESTVAGARVSTDVRRTIADGSEQAQDRWRFDLVDQDGWRVCGAQRIG